MLSWGLLLATVAYGAYTNLADNVISGVPIKLDRREVTLSNSVEVATLPLSIFPESEKRRLAVDFGSTLFIPPAVMRAMESNDKAIARSRKRLEKGLCTEDASNDFCEKSLAARKRYLDRQVNSGVITTAERKLLEAIR